MNKQHRVTADKEGTCYPAKGYIHLSAPLPVAGDSVQVRCPQVLLDNSMQHPDTRRGIDVRHFRDCHTGRVTQARYAHTGKVTHLQVTQLKVRQTSKVAVQW